MMKKKFPALSLLILTAIVIFCFACEGLMAMDPRYMDLAYCNEAPGKEFFFGTDTMGRDIFSMICHGGRISLTIGFLATLLSTILAVFAGSVSGCAPARIDGVLMALTELFLSVPGLLLTVFLQAVFGGANVYSLSVVIGLTGWMSMAKVVRTEVLQLRHTDYLLAAKCLGGGFFHVLFRHLAPNFFPSVLFMAVMNVRNAIIAESTLSFVGLGLPVEEVSWGSILSLSENALLSRSWWIILIPGAFLVGTLLCLTNLGNYMRGNANRRHSNLGCEKNHKKNMKQL